MITTNLQDLQSPNAILSSSAGAWDQVQMLKQTLLMFFIRQCVRLFQEDIY